MIVENLIMSRSYRKTPIIKDNGKHKQTFNGRSVGELNSKYKVLVQKIAFVDDKIIIKCESADGLNAIKPWSVSIISYENGLYVHELYKTCFQEISADKYFSVFQGKDWTGGDECDDYC